MSIEQITAVRYKCQCDHVDCAHAWESDSIPNRCAKCKRGTWNRAPIRVGRNGNPIEAFGKKKTISEWGREYNLSASTISARLKHGWKVEDAISKPVHKKEE